MTPTSSVFISYTHADRDRVLPIASHLSRLGLTVWMDTKDLAGGQVVVQEISRAIADAAIYCVCLSPAALDSAWVNHELNTALTREITHGRPKVVPIVISKVALPPVIASRLYIDASTTLAAAAGQLKKVVGELLPDLPGPRVTLSKADSRLRLSSVMFRLHAKTTKEYGGGFEHHERAHVEEEAHRRVRELRKKATGVLLNFVSASEMDLTSSYPRFPNGEVLEQVEEVPGTFQAAIAMKATADVQVVNPDETKVEQLVSSKLNGLGVSRVVYSFGLSSPIAQLPQAVLQRLQSQHLLLGWDPDTGADVELPDDLRVSVACTEEQITVGIETKYAFQLADRAKGFSVREFAESLIERP